MVFVKFTETGKSFVPKVSISSRGLVNFSQGSCKRFNLSKYKVCVAYYDGDNRKIGFEFLENEEAEGAINLRLRRIGADIGAKSFLTYFNILPNETMMYPAEAGEHENWIVVDLSKGEERKNSDKTPEFI